LIPTIQGAGLYQIQANAIIPREDAALAEAGGRLLHLHQRAVACVQGDRNVSLLEWRDNHFEKQWQILLPTESHKATWIACHDQAISVADDQGSIHLLSRKDGSTIRQINHRTLLHTAPLLINGRLIVADRDGKLTAYYLPGFNQ
jgi:hypothetical protein